uniref:Uncharacterized protein n=1 Tax=Schistocephalus solidus TaxID=70667 RepID=A0A0X3Q2K7_SCHSO
MPAHHLHFSNELAQCLASLPGADENASVKSRWCQLRDTVQSTALDVLGRACHQHQHWFYNKDAASNNQLAEKIRLHTAYVDHSIKAAFCQSRRFKKQLLREMLDAWMARKADEIQEHTDRNEWKNFFTAIKAIYCPTDKGSVPLFNTDGTTLLTEKTQILRHWAKHFNGVSKRPSNLSDAAIDRLPKVEANADLDLPPSLDETIRAVQQHSNGKTLGAYAIPAEIYKQGGPQLMNLLTALFQERWHQGQVSQSFKEATIVHLYRKNGNRNSLKTKEESRCSTLPEKFSPAFSSIALTAIWYKNSCRKASAVSTVPATSLT